MGVAPLFTSRYSSTLLFSVIILYYYCTRKLGRSRPEPHGMLKRRAQRFQLHKGAFVFGVHRSNVLHIP